MISLKYVNNIGSRTCWHIYALCHSIGSNGSVSPVVIACKSKQRCSPLCFHLQVTEQAIFLLTERASFATACRGAPSGFRFRNYSISGKWEHSTTACSPGNNTSSFTDACVDVLGLHFLRTPCSVSVPEVAKDSALHFQTVCLTNRCCVTSMSPLQTGGSRGDWAFPGAVCGTCGRSSRVPTTWQGLCASP